MAKMRAVQVPKANGPFEIVEREIPQPGPGDVRVKVQACGVCHSDSITKEGLFPNIAYPRIPGHEVAGVVDAIGSGVKGWKVGDRVGIGWYGGHCGYCDCCRRGYFDLCLVDRAVTGISRDGGYAEYMVTPAVTLALIPDEVSAVDAGPLMCAGVTTFNSLRNSGVGPGEVVAVLGIGGLGHLGVQFAAKCGCKTVAIARGADKVELAKKLGAHVYIDSDKQDVAAELQKLGGAKTILATVTAGDAMSAAFGGLGIDGKLMVLGVPNTPIQVNAITAIFTRAGVRGWYSGRSIDSQDTLRFSALTGVRPMTQAFPLDKVNEAYDVMMNGTVRFRAVLKIGA